MSAMDLVDETNPIESGYYEDRSGRWEFMSLKALSEAGGRVTRVRWLQTGRAADLSYIHGELPDGTPVHVLIPGLHFIPVRMLKGVLINWARREGVYGKGIGLLDNWSVLS